MIYKKITIPVLFLALPLLAWAFSGGPPDEKTGAPGEGICTDCHATYPLNSGDGTFTISGPATFQSDQTYEITVELSDPGQSRWGFEITPQDQGVCTITDAVNTQLSSSGGKSYVKHTSTGTYAGTSDGPVSWTFDWTAPSSAPESVIFYAGGNAANNNSATSNDYIYSAQFISYRSTGIDDISDYLRPVHLSVGNFPNPFNARTTINFNLAESGRVHLAIYDVTGRLITKLADEYLQAGPHSRQWNSLDSDNIPVASGMYFVRLTARDYSASHRMMLLK